MHEFRQYAALPYIEQDADIVVCLITSRDTGRWVIPKGWPKPDLAPHELAAREARQEAGLVGAVSAVPVGNYSYRKRLHFFLRVVCHVTVFPLLCDSQKLKWREKGERQLVWTTCDDAARRVDERELSRLLADFPAWLVDARDNVGHAPQRCP